ncbi:MAG TPA: 4-hydroxy-3-methylbut-2-enyl diphosphate reductase, partial [Cytophagaceae bacterium]
FDPLKDLSKLAVVNQTTLLASETLAIADFLRDILIKKYGEENLAHHFGESNKDKLGNTLCYATNVNQEAARMMLEEDADYAIIIGGHNSSNTSQLYKLAEEKFGEKAYYIESEQDILSKEAISHFDFKNKKVVTRSFLTEELKPVKIMITAGASCPDGIIHQVVIKINSFFEAGQIKDVDEVLAEFTEAF